MIVYLLTNLVSKKFYVGQTRHHTLEKRWNRTLSNAKGNGHLSAAIRKYGAEQFQRTILSHASCQEELDLLERFWIAFYRSNQRQYGYNLQAGGQLWRGVHTKEVRKRISKSTKRGWDNKSKKERWEFALATRLRWLSRTESERDQISLRITEALVGKPRTDIVWNRGKSGKACGKGKPSARKGRTFGPQRNPCQSWGPKSAEHRQHISEALKMHFAQKKPCMGTDGTSGRSPAEVARIARETRLSVALKEMVLARQQLRNVKKRLDQLENELQGGCEW